MDQRALFDKKKITLILAKLAYQSIKYAISLYLYLEKLFNHLKNIGNLPLCDAKYLVQLIFLRKAIFHSSVKIPSNF